LKQKNLTTPSYRVNSDNRIVKRSEDFALLVFDNGVLYNNVFAKGDIQNAFQQVFLDGNQFGWEWEWPQDTGPSVKTYPEVILGRSPWSKAVYGSQLPCSLEKVRYVLDFDFTTEADGSWCESFDFWITNKADPEAKDITCNLCIWTRVHQIEAAYLGSHETLKIGGGTYEAIIETPADQPSKTWNTLFVVDTEARSHGSLELQPFMEILTKRGLAKPDHFLATAELGNEVAYGKGKTIVQKFGLR
jgi:Glycosyl hydrolase family 12